MVEHQNSKLKKLGLLFLAIAPLFINAQVVTEKIQLDTIFETIKVIYQPTDNSTYYFKKRAVFADDTTRIAIEKSYTSYGQNGLYKVYYPSGRLKIKTVFANNKINGEWTYYDLTGTIITKGVYRNGIKHGYWAYKSLRTYGRYKKGLKHKKWRRFDENEKKYFSHYRHGVLTGGEGVGNEKPIILYDTTKTQNHPAVIAQVDGLKISREYRQTISYLSTNSVFRKALKTHFGSSLKEVRAIKKLYKNNTFQYAISPQITALSVATFIKESVAGKIVVAKIDTVLKNEAELLTLSFSGEQQKEDKTIQNYSTDLTSPMKVTFSEVKHNLLRVDVIWNYNEEKRSFQLLLYFNDQGVLKGAEYQKK